MMTKFITELESLSRAKELLEKCDFNVQSYVEERLLDLYKLVETDPRENPEKIRPRMAVCLFSTLHIASVYICVRVYSPCFFIILYPQMRRN